MKSAGGTVLAISPQRIAQARETVKDLGLSFDVLSDPANRVARQYDLAFRVDEATQAKLRSFGIDLSKENADAEPELPVPATFVVDTTGVIRLAFADPDYKNRLDPEEVVGTVRSLAGTPAR